MIGQAVRVREWNAAAVKCRKLISFAPTPTLIQGLLDECFFSDECFSCVDLKNVFRFLFFSQFLALSNAVFYSRQIRLWSRIALQVFIDIKVIWSKQHVKKLPTHSNLIIVILLLMRKFAFKMFNRQVMLLRAIEQQMFLGIPNSKEWERVQILSLNCVNIDEIIIYVMGNRKSIYFWPMQCFS